jgi:hypothetical protein
MADFVAEHASYPNGSHDDLVDVGAYAVRVAITKWAPPPPRPPAPPSPIEDPFTPDFIDFETLAL